MMTDSEPAFSAALRRLFSASEQVLGCGLRWKDADQEMRRAMPEELVVHLHPYCLEVKASDSVRSERCRQHCAFAAARWQGARRPACISTCHAGCRSWRQPLQVDGELLGFLIIGPFRASDDDEKLPPRPQHLEAMADIVLNSIRHLAALRAVERNDFKDQSLHPALNQLSRELQHYVHGLRLEDLAERCGLSVSRLQHLCRAELQATVSELCQRALLQRVQRGLQDSRRSIGSIAIDAGFDDQRYFATWFRRLTGMSPSTWRRQERDMT